MAHSPFPNGWPWKRGLCKSPPLLPLPLPTSQKGSLHLVPQAGETPSAQLQRIFPAQAQTPHRPIVCQCLSEAGEAETETLQAQVQRNALPRTDRKAPQGLPKTPRS